MEEPCDQELVFHIGYSLHDQRGARPKGLTGEEKQRLERLAKRGVIASEIGAAPGRVGGGEPDGVATAVLWPISVIAPARSA